MVQRMISSSTLLALKIVSCEAKYYDTFQYVAIGVVHRH